METTTQLTTLNLPRVGAHWPEQGGIFIGLIPGQNGQPDYALIAPDHQAALFENVQWGPRGVDVPAANSDWDGATNTLVMNGAGSQLARDILQLEIDGFCGFYLPARHELRLMKLVAPQLIVDDWHWSSTQYSAHLAWDQGFDGGSQLNGGKDSALRARAVRRFLIIQ